MTLTSNISSKQAGSHNPNPTSNTNQNLPHYFFTPYNIGFWNLRGFSTIFNLHGEEIEQILQYEVLCLFETKLTSETVNLPSYLENYTVYSN